MSRTMLQALVEVAGRLAAEFNRLFFGQRLPVTPTRDVPLPAPRRYQPLTRLVLTDGVGRTLFEEYAEHREGAHGDDETGWVLLGVREASEALVLATLPAGS